MHLTSDSAFVYTSYDTETQTYGGKTDVVVGLTDGNFYEITSGLTQGCTVYYTEKQSLMNFFAGMMGMNNTGNRGNANSFGGQMPGGGNFGGQMPGNQRPDSTGKRN